MNCERQWLFLGDLEAVGGNLVMIDEVCLVAGYVSGGFRVRKAIRVAVFGGGRARVQGTDHREFGRGVPLLPSSKFLPDLVRLLE